MNILEEEHKAKVQENAQEYNSCHCGLTTKQITEENTYIGDSGNVYCCNCEKYICHADDVVIKDGDENGETTQGDRQYKSI